jgi:hypothetical protein
MKVFLAIAATAVLCLPASAEWQIQASKDRMTDNVARSATVQAKAPDQGVSADLYVGCMNGEPMAQARLSHPLTRGRIGTVWRFDEGPQRPAFLHVFADPNSIPFVGVPTADFTGKRRFRFQIQPTGGPSLFYDFDISGLERVLSSIKCK